jgi:hypothetical protein
MKKLLLLLFPILVSGCGGPVKANVYGASGKTFTAPDVCAALVACQASNETACYYDRSIYQNPNGTTVESGCKEVKK